MSALVDPETGEVVPRELSSEYPEGAWVPGTGPLARDDALRLTAQIKGYTGMTCYLLREAKERGAAAALGYEDWESYVRAEFDISRSQSYRLIAQADAILELAESAGLSHARDFRPLVSGREAEEIAPHMDAVKAEVEHNVADLPDDATDDDRAEVVRDTVRQSASIIHEVKRKEREKKALEASQSGTTQAAPETGEPLSDPAGLSPEVPPAPSGQSESDATSSPVASAPAPIPEDKALRSEWSRCWSGMTNLLELDPRKVAALIAVDERESLVADDRMIRSWLDDFAEALRPDLKVAK